MDLVEMQLRPAKKRARYPSPPPDHPANDQAHQEQNIDDQAHNNDDQAQNIDDQAQNNDDQEQNNHDQAQNIDDQAHNNDDQEHNNHDQAQNIDDQAHNNDDQEQNNHDQAQNIDDQAHKNDDQAIPGLFGFPVRYRESCALAGCALPRESINHSYCCIGHQALSSNWSSKTTAFHVYDGFSDKNNGREQFCYASIILKADDTDVGIPTLADPTIFTILPWDNESIFQTTFGRSCDYLFFSTPPPRNISWKSNGRNKRIFNDKEVDVTLLNLNVKNIDAEVTKGKFDREKTKWQLYLYQYSDLSLYCLSMVVKGFSPLTLPPKTPKPKRPKGDENPDADGGDGKGIREYSPPINPNAKTGKTKPRTVVSGNVNNIPTETEEQVNKTKLIRPTEYCSVLDVFGLEKFIKGFFYPPVSADSHHGFVAEYGKYRDLDLGFHENNSDVTLNVSMGKQYVGGELYFQGTRYDKHGNTDAKSEVALFAPSRSSHYVNITLKNIFEPLYRELYTFDPTFFFTPSFLKEINEDTVESFRSVISESSPSVFVSEMLRPSFCEMMLSKVENFREWVNVTKIQIMRPNTMSKYGIVLDDFGLEDSMLMEGFGFPVSKVFLEVCGSTSDSHHGFFVEYGTARDVDLGFHVDDSETTLSVCLREGNYISKAHDARNM